MTSRALVLGNGESRAWFNPSEKKIKVNDVVTWGCNAIHRDGHVDNLVAIDYGIQQEIYISGYHKWSQCWFADWNPVPAEIADTMFLGYDIPESFIYRTERVGNHTEQCVIAGTDPAAFTERNNFMNMLHEAVGFKPQETLEERVESITKENPNLDAEDVRLKLSKDVGVWITYIKDSDTIKDIDFPKRWSAGTTAIHLACQEGVKEVYMLGFDLSSYDKPINNVYKGTKYYFPEDAKGFNTVNWMNQLKTVFKEFPDTQFYWVDWAYDTPPCYNHSNVGYLTKTELCDKLKIL